MSKVDMELKKVIFAGRFTSVVVKFEILGLHRAARKAN
jgi:hypothetical protein